MLQSNYAFVLLVLNNKISVQFVQWITLREAKIEIFLTVKYVFLVACKIVIVNIGSIMEIEQIAEVAVY